MPLADEDWFNQLKDEHIPRIEKMLEKEVKHLAKLERQLRKERNGIRIFGFRLFPLNYELIKACEDYIEKSKYRKGHYSCRLNEYKRYANKLERELKNK